MMNMVALQQSAALFGHKYDEKYFPDGYNAHLLTFQVNLQPKRRDLSFDTAIDINLFPSRWEDATGLSKGIFGNMDDLPPVIIYPLIISDTMENTLVGRSYESIRQFGLSLSGTVGNVGLSAGGGNANELDQRLIGQDRNSLVTVGSDGATMHIRIGAYNAGSEILEMVPRSYNISTVVLTKKPANHPLTSLTALTYTSFSSTEDGRTLRSARAGGRIGLAQSVLNIIDDYGYILLKNCDLGIQYMDETDLALSVFRMLNRGDYFTFDKCIIPKRHVQEHGQALQTRTLHQMIAELRSLQRSSRHSTLLVPLKDKQLTLPKPPTPDQLAACVTDQNILTFTLSGGKNLRPNLVLGKLHTGHGSMIANPLTVSDDGQTITMSFPSLTQLNVQVAGKVPLELTIKEQDQPGAKEDKYTYFVPPGCLSTVKKLESVKKDSVITQNIKTTQTVDDINNKKSISTEDTKESKTTITTTTQ